MKATTLPVVAMGSIPHIYRRASFSLRATPSELALMTQGIR